MNEPRAGIHRELLEYEMCDESADTDGHVLHSSLCTTLTQQAASWRLRVEGLRRALEKTGRQMGGDGDVPEVWCPACNRSVFACETYPTNPRCVGNIARDALTADDKLAGEGP